MLGSPGQETIATNERKCIRQPSADERGIAKRDVLGSLRKAMHNLFPHDGVSQALVLVAAGLGIEAGVLSLIFT